MPKVFNRYLSTSKILNMQISKELCSQTPCLLLDRSKLQRNIERMISRYKNTGIRLRPHLKSSKCIHIVEIFNQLNIHQFTVSTIKEAEYFAANGVKDMLYAVSIVPNKVARIDYLNKQGANVAICVDNIETVNALIELSIEKPIELYIEIDVDQHRTGVNPNNSEWLISIAKLVNAVKNLKFKGVFAHAGESYSCKNLKEITEAAINERKLTSIAAQHIKQSGIDCATISVGSTPTASVGGNFYDVTEMRAGVFVFQDLFQSNLGICKQSDIALSVLTTVISQSTANKRLIVDAGGIALSKDRSTESQNFDCKYGLVTDINGNIISDLILDKVNQEHGYITTVDGSPIDFERYKIGSLLRILPNHACMTASAHSGYHIVENNMISDYWPRINGW